MDTVAIIAAMESKRQQLLAAAEGIAAAIKTVRAVFNVPAETAPPVPLARLVAPRPTAAVKRARVKRRPAAQPADGTDLSRLMTALKGGPLKVGEIEERFGVSRYRLSRLVGDGVVVATGVTNSRRIALPAKEAP